MEHKVIDGSLKSILSVTAPLMVSMASTGLFYVVDRLMLAGYSINSMNASVLSGGFIEMFLLMFIGIIYTAEVFVGQFNGSKNYKELASPTWQMIYLSLALILLFFPIAYFSDYINLLPTYLRDEGVIYQKILMYSLPITLIKTSLSTFFIGQGKTKIITVSVAVGVVVNIVLDYVFIYGYGMGCKGAATATAISETVDALILAFVFFNKHNRINYNTLGNCKFNKKMTWEIIKLGFPLAFGNFIVLALWYVVQGAANNISNDQATIFNIGNVLFKLFMMIIQALEKSSSAICANMIGRNDLKSVDKAYKTFIGISLFFGLFTGILLVGFPEWILGLLNLLPDNLTSLYDEILKIFVLITVSITIEAVVCSTWGILIGGGDAKYAMITYQICTWIILVAPITALYYWGMLRDVKIIFILYAATSFAAQIVLHFRLKSLKWYRKLV
ncbi:MAG: MATE family efflux transporter [Holosporaceae bacterium]|jgi:MATE family multidrug resistance protein|nr:MATE family efflux transporter [Holosporaceae bacterium]